MQTYIFPFLGFYWIYEGAVNGIITYAFVIVQYYVFLFNFIVNDSLIWKHLALK